MDPIFIIAVTSTVLGGYLAIPKLVNFVHFMRKSNHQNLGLVTAVAVIVTCALAIQLLFMFISAHVHAH